MLTKKILISALIAAGTLGTAAAPLTSAAASNVEVYVNTAPPSPRYERVPAPRDGYVWAPGHWRWSDNRYRYVWVGGHWERTRPGYSYRAPHWVERDGRWHYRPAQWDRDGDGVPNRYDAHPDNPYRR
ncbi:MAG TPA: hypothetical protein VKF40_28430 [Burkholderiales bacterium]|nr:hypothetical protein [Burkholderiales bacterium]